MLTFRNFTQIFKYHCLLQKKIDYSSILKLCCILESLEKFKKAINAWLLSPDILV